MGTITYSGTLVVTSCWCGIHLAIPDDLYSSARSEGKAIACPLGHKFVYGNTTQKENDRLRNRLELEKQNAEFWRKKNHATERRLSATKGVLTKTKKRIENGVCPCCSRYFANVERHIKSQHPDYANKGE